MSNDIFPLKSQVDQGDPAPSSPSGQCSKSSPETGSGLSANVPIAQAENMRVQAKHLLRALGSCEHYDHNGNCQTHFVSKPCEVDSLREAVMEFEVAMNRVSDRSGANEVSGPTNEDGTHAERDPQGYAQENPQ